MWYVEWAQTPQNRRGRMVSLGALSTLLKSFDPGYSSIYMFSEDDANQIMVSGRSRGFERFAVYGKFLIMDIDNGVEGLVHVENCLQEKGLQYEVWFSGSKGYHIYIPHKGVMSQALPYSHKIAALDLIKDADKFIDMSLYQHSRLLSLPGRIHPKTKKRKVFMKSVAGSVLDLKILPMPEYKLNFNIIQGDSLLNKGLERALNICLQPPSPGNRHTAIWGIAKDLAEGGLGLDTVLDLLKGINNQWKTPKTDQEVEAAVLQAFQTLTVR